MNITDFYSQSFSSNTGYSKPTIEEIAQDAANSAAENVKEECSKDFEEKDPEFAGSVASGITSADIEKWNNKQDAIPNIDEITDSAELIATALQPEDIDLSYDESNHIITLTAGSVVKTIDVADFVKDGMVSNVNLDGTNLVISFNTDAGVSDITVDLSSLIDLSDYYTKDEVDQAIDSIEIPDVPEWALSEQKPTYTANEVGALPADTVIPTVPSNVSAFTNDAGYITSYTETDPVFSASTAKDITAEDINNWNNKQNLLTFDEQPMEDSDNPVKSKGIKSYVDTKVANVISDAGADFDTLGEAQQKYNELNAKYVALHNIVYNMADDEAATEMNPEYVANSLSSGNKIVVVEKGELGDVTIPEVTGSTSVTAPMQDGAVVTLTSPKSFTLTNTSESVEPVSVSVNAPYNDASTSNTTVYLQGEYEEISVENASIGKASDREAPVVHNINVNNNVDEEVENPKMKNSNISATFTGDSEDPSVVTSNVPNLTITNYNAAVDENDNPVTPPSLIIDAEDSTVTLNSKWDNVVATVSPETLIVNGSAHINKLTCSQKVIVKVSKASKIDEVISDYTGVNVDYVKVNVDQANQSQMTSTAECTLTGDIEKSYGWSFSMLSSDYPVWKLNGHNITIQKERVGVVLLRNKACLDVYGNGTITSQDYGIWSAGEECVANVYGGDWVCTNHALYAEKGTINVYGGTFRVTDEDKRYVLNCLDASYTSNPRKAQINVYGGKFYDFDPSNSMSEPNGPVNFVANGYHVVQGTDEIGTYYEVVAD